MPVKTKKTETKTAQKKTTRKAPTKRKAPSKTKSLVVQNTDPGSLLQLAIEKGMEMDKLSQLLDIYQRWEDGKAKKKYFEALAIFQSECPEIKKTKHIHYKTKSGYVVDYWYEPLGGIVAQVKHLLETCGFSYTFTQNQEEAGCIEITCYLHHKDGHTESAPLKAHADTSGNKNAIQSIASTVTYLRRYTFCGITGITTADSDDDGQSYDPGKNKQNQKMHKVQSQQVEDAELVKDDTIKTFDKNKPIFEQIKEFVSINQTKLFEISGKRGSSFIMQAKDLSESEQGILLKELEDLCRK